MLDGVIESTECMDDASVKETRVTMRRVQEHLRQSHLNMGAQEESLGFVDLVYHPNNPHAALNYVTPRRNTAWVSGKHIEVGLSALREKGRPARVTFSEGLFPPIFARSLRELGLEIEYETPLMVYQTSENSFKMPDMPTDTTISVADDQQSLAIWWYIWRNAFYEVAATGVDPLVLGRDMASIYHGQQRNLILYRYGFPIGAARLTLNDGTAHILAQALLKECRSSELDYLLQAASVRAALDADCDLVFTSGEHESTRALSRKMGFVDSGSIVAFSDASSSANGETDGQVVQPVLVI